MESVVRKFFVKTANNNVRLCVRERYLRTDLKCCSSLCTQRLCGQGDDQKLSGRVLVLPAYDVWGTFYQLIDECQQNIENEKENECESAFANVILLDSVRRQMLRHGFSRARDLSFRLANDKRRPCVLVHNDNFEQLHARRCEGEHRDHRTVRAMFKCARWIAEHLASFDVCVLIVSDADEIWQFASDNGDDSRVSLMRTRDYLFERCRVSDASLCQLHDSLLQQEEQDDDDDNDDDGDCDGDDGQMQEKVGFGYAAYRSSDAIDAEVKSGALLVGTMRVDKRNVAQAWVRANDGAMVLLASAAAMNRAIDGDRVAVRVLDEAEWRAPSTRMTRNDGDGSGKEKDDDNEQNDDENVARCGQVVGLVRSGERRNYVCTMQTLALGSGGGVRHVLVVPMDRRVPKIRVRTRDASQWAEQRVVVSIDNWPVHSRYPSGHVMRRLGALGELDTDVNSVLVERDVSTTPFSAAMMAGLPRSASEWRPSGDEVARRRDLRRSHLVFSIDPPGCEDIDDALSVRRFACARTGHAMIELGVHIADVTHFVEHNSLLDLEARARGTTVYLAHRRFDMLPEVLSAHLCSLRADVDRYAMSAMFEFDVDDAMALRRTWFGRTVIRSSNALAYGDAQLLLERSPPLDARQLQSLGGRKRVSALTDAIDLLAQLAAHLRSLRRERGSLDLASAEVRFEFDGGAQSSSSSSSPTSLKTKRELEVNQLVAEFMIFANQCVAHRIYTHFASESLLRRHPEPLDADFEALRRCAASRGFAVDTSSNRALARSLDAAVVDDDPSFNYMLRTLATRAMVEAEYFSTGQRDVDEFAHYGLAAPFYTHFTSPIRRYADVVVHRLLWRSIVGGGGESAAAAPFDDETLQALAGHINTRHRNAKLASADSTDIFLAKYMAARPDECHDAVVYSVRANGFLAQVPGYSVRGAIYARDIVASSDGRVTAVRCEPSGGVVRVELASGQVQQLRLFDHLTVRVAVRPSRVRLPQLSLSFVRVGVDRAARRSTIERRDVQDIVKQPLVAAADSASAASRSGGRDAIVRLVTQSSASTKQARRQRMIDARYSQSSHSFYVVVQDALKRASGARHCDIFADRPFIDPFKPPKSHGRRQFGAKPSLL
jgi:DIS3-like exonuclease 1